MKITALKVAVKTPGRWNVFVDGKYSFSLDESQVLEWKLRIGQEIDDERLERLKNDSNFGKAYARALELVLRRLRSRKEILDYARRKEWDEQTTRRVVEKLESRGYIDDRAFCEAWVRSRENIKPSSRRKLTAELRQKGVSGSIIESVLSQDDAHDELAMLRRIVEKKRARYDDERKFMAYLARQGFSFDAISSVLAEIRET